MDENLYTEEKRNPFKFLDSYTKEDRDIFFGRETELEEIYRKFYKSKILLVYGKSGTGKSSIINCGLMSKIPPEDVLVIPVRCGKDPVKNLKSDLIKFANSQNFVEDHNGSIIEIIEEIYLENFKPITLLFDQFEEIFILSSSDDRRQLIEELLKIINSKIRVNLVIIFREEYFASFSEFENDIPNLFENRVRIEKLSNLQVKEIIEKPCSICNVSIETGVAEKIAKLLSQDTGAVELTYFQILMDKLYKIATKRSKGKIVLKNEDLLSIGDVGNMLGDFLNNQLLEMENASDVEAVLKTMISEDGTKKRVTKDDIVEATEKLEISISDWQLKIILQELISSRILSEKDEQGFYEIKHDSLAQRIFDRLTADERKLKEIQLLLNNSFKQFEQVGSLISERALRHVEPFEDKLVLTPEINNYLIHSKQAILKQKKKRRNVSIGLVSIAIIILSFFTIWNIIERKKAVKQSEIALFREKESRTNELVAHSYLQLDKNPTLSFRLAEEAYRLYPESMASYKALLNSYYSEPFYSILYNHYDHVISAILTNNYNSLIFSVSRDGAYHVNLSTGKLNMMGGDYAVVNCFGMSLESKLLLIGDLMGNVGIASLQDSTFKVSKLSKISKDRIRSVRFGKMNSNIISTSGKMVNIFSLSGEKIKELSFNDEVFSAATTPNGNLICFQADRNYLNHSAKIRLSEHDTNGNITSNLSWNSADYVMSATFSNNLKYIAICSYVDIICPKIYNLIGERMYELKGSKWNANFINFTSNDKYAIAGNDGGQIFMWDLKSNLPQKNKVSNQRLNSIKYHKDGETFLVSCDDSTAKLVSIDGSVIQEYIGHKGEVKDAKFSSDFNKIITSSLGGTTKIFSIDGTLIKSITDNFNNVVQASTFSPDGKTIATVGPDWRLNIYDSTGKNSAIFHWRDQQELNTGAAGSFARWTCRKEIHDSLGNSLEVFNWHKYYVNSADISWDKKYIVTASNDSTAKLWDFDGNELQVFKGHSSPVRFATFSWDSKSVITTGWDNTIRIWSLDGEELKKIDVPNNGKLLYAIFTTDDKYICAESYRNITYDINLDGEILETQEMWTYDITSPFISSVEYSNDGKYLLAGSAIYGSVNIFDTKGTLLKKIETGHFGTYSPDGQFILTTYDDNKAYILDKNGILLKQLDGHKRSVNKGSFSSDGTLIATTSNDFTARIWDLEGNEIMVFNHDTIVMDAAFSPDNKYLTTVCNDGTITSWLLDPEMIIDKVNNEVNNGFTWQLDLESKKNYRIPFNNIDEIELKSEQLAKSLMLLSNSNQNLNLSIAFADSLSYLLDSNYYLNKVESIALNQIKSKISSNCTDYSLILLAKREFEVALRYAELAKKADPQLNKLYTKLALSYLLNNKWNEAKEIYEIWQDSIFVQDRYRQIMRYGFLDDLNEMESKGITHENFEKVRKLLGEENKNE